MLRKSLIILSIFLATICFAGEYDSYVDTVQKYYKDISKTSEVIHDWEDGVRKDLGYTLDHFVINFEFYKGMKTTDSNIVITGILVMTGFCYDREGVKVRVVQMRGMAILLSKEGKILKRLSITKPENTRITGWDGLEVKTKI